MFLPKLKYKIKTEKLKDEINYKSSFEVFHIYLELQIPSFVLLRMEVLVLTLRAPNTYIL